MSGIYSASRSVFRGYRSTLGLLKEAPKVPATAVGKSGEAVVAEGAEEVNLHNRLSLLSGAPEEHLKRHVVIFRPARVATQQGKGTKVQKWHLKFSKMDGSSDRWTNPLMGWTSTGDPLTNLDVSFPTADAAMEFAKRNGFEYTVEDRNTEKENVRKFQAYGRSMVHQWRHTQIPVYEDDNKK